MISGLVMKYIATNQRNEAEKQDLNGEKVVVRAAECLGECHRKYYVLEKFSTEVIICPHCQSEHKVRCYKNGSIRIESIPKKLQKAQDNI